MKKFILICLVSFLLSFPTISYAEDSQAKAGIMPGNPLYFFDILGEKMALIFAAKPEKKFTLYLKYAQERTSELDKLASQNKSKYIDKVVKNFQYNMDNASKKFKELEAKGQNVDRLATQLQENALRQQNVLHRVLTQVPEVAKSAIQRAIDTSKNGLEQAAQSIQKKNLEQENKSNSALPEVK